MVEGEMIFLLRSEVRNIWNVQRRFEVWGSMGGGVHGFLLI